MRVAATIAIAALLAVGFFVEKRASLCGAGWLPSELPYGLRADWFNGRFWLIDAEGWGVIAPPVELEVGSDDLPVRWLRRYTTEHGFIAEVALESGEVAYVAVDRPAGGSGIRKTSLEPAALQQRVGSDLDSICWIDVRPASCFFGMFWGARALVAGGIVGSLLVALRSGRQTTGRSSRPS